MLQRPRSWVLTASRGVPRFIWRARLMALSRGSRIRCRVPGGVALNWVERRGSQPLAARAGEVQGAGGRCQHQGGDASAAHGGKQVWAECGLLAIVRHHAELSGTRDSQLRSFLGTTTRSSGGGCVFQQCVLCGYALLCNRRFAVTALSTITSLFPCFGSTRPRR